MLRNLSAKLKFIAVLIAQTVAASVNSTGVDCADFGSMLFLINVGSFSFTGTNKITVKLQVSDDNTNWSDAAAEDMYVIEGAAPTYIVLDATGEDSKVYALEYRGTHRYARVALVVGGTVSVPVAITSVGGYSELMPPL